MKHFLIDIHIYIQLHIHVNPVQASTYIHSCAQHRFINAYMRIACMPAYIRRHVSVYNSDNDKPTNMVAHEPGMSDS